MTVRLPDGFGDAPWFDAWLQAFAPGAVRHRVELPGQAFAPALIEGSARVLRCRVRFLVAPVNVHSPRYGWRLDELPDLAETARRLGRCLAQSGCGGLELALVPENGRTLELLRALGGTRRWVVAIEEADSTLIVDTTGDAGVYGKQLPARLAKNLDRQEAKLRAQGAVTFHEAGGGGDWAEWLEAGLAMEASGWKGAEGSAIVQRDNEATFYRAVAAAGAAEGRLRLFVIALDGRPIAFRLSILDEGTLFLLKTAYDETFARFGPGNLLLRLVLRHCFEDPEIRAVDLVGHPEWKRAWSTHAERLMRVKAAPAGSLAGYLLMAEGAAKRARARFAAPEPALVTAGREEAR